MHSHWMRQNNGPEGKPLAGRAQRLFDAFYATARTTFMRCLPARVTHSRSASTAGDRVYPFCARATRLVSFQLALITGRAAAAAALIIGSISAAVGNAGITILESCRKSAGGYASTTVCCGATH
jgi:hypothetical protein